MVTHDRRLLEVEAVELLLDLCRRERRAFLDRNNVGKDAGQRTLSLFLELLGDKESGTRRTCIWTRKDEAESIFSKFLQ